MVLMKLNKLKTNILWVPFLFMLLTTSCVNTRKATYFNGVNETTLSSNTPIPESKIQKNDLLSIYISSLNPEASAFFNGPNTTSITPAGSNPINGYLVSADGNIQLPILGSI